MATQTKENATQVLPGKEEISKERAEAEKMKSRNAAPCGM
jgi:hypothetical protein